MELIALRVASGESVVPARPKSAKKTVSKSTPVDAASSLQDQAADKGRREETDWRKWGGESCPRVRVGRRGKERAQRKYSKLVQFLVPRDWAWSDVSQGALEAGDVAPSKPSDLRVPEVRRDRGGQYAFSSYV